MKLFFQWILLMVFSVNYAQQISLDTSLVSDQEGYIEQWWYWSGGFPVEGRGFAPNAVVSVHATDPNGYQWRDFTGITNDAGEFSVQVSAKKTTSVLGTHIIKATDSEGNTATAELHVTENKKEVVEVEPDKKILTLSQFNSIGVTLKASRITSEGGVTVHIFSPNESGSALTGAMYADRDGNFSTTFNSTTPSYPWGESFPDVVGVWRITVQDNSAYGNYGSTTFRVVPDNASVNNYSAIGQQDTAFAPTPITHFEIEGINSNDSSVSSLDFYEDFTDKIFDLTAGSTYTVKIKGKNGSSYAPDTYTLFIDWNHNGILDEDNEIISEGYIFGSTGQDDKYTEFAFKVPENAISGNTRLRLLKMQSATAYSMFWPIGASGYYYNDGQAEDYTLNIEGGMDDPGCSYVCPSDITVKADEGKNTATVDYELPFTCNSLPAASCNITYPGNNFETGLSVSTALVANDFDVPQGQTMKITKISINQARYSYGADLYFYKDNNGQPGELVASYENLAYESQTEIGTGFSSFPMYEAVIALPQTLELANGKYWVGARAQGPLVFWESTTKGTTLNAYSSYNSGTTWEKNEGFDGVFKVIYECEGAAPESVLVQGLSSGEEFPVGNTVVVHNLVLNGVVIDTCIFNVHVESSNLNTSSFAKEQIKFYPNPAHDLLNISYIEKIDNIEIYNMSGQVVVNVKMGQTSGQLDVSKLSPGIYLLKINTLKGSQTVKIVKK